MEYILHIFIMICLFGILSVSLNYIAGYTGILSLSHASFYGVGAYVTGILFTQSDFNFWLILLLSAVITALISLLISFPILRLKGDSLMLVSFGFAIIMYNVMLNWTSLTNGALGIKGIPAAKFFDITFFSKPLFVILTLIFLVLILLFFHFIIKSPYGTVIQGIRENKTVMENMGYNAKFYQHSVFVLGSMIAGVAGSLFATYITYIEPSLFHLLPSVIIFVMVIFGGFGNIWGSLLGAVVLVIFPELLRFIGLPDTIMAETQQILYGLLLFVLMYFRPQGLIGKYKM